MSLESGSVHVPNCKSFLVTEAERKHVRLRARFQYLYHPRYYPDPASSNYHLFPGLKKRLKGRHFSSDVEVIAAAETWLDGHLSDFF